MGDYSPEASNLVSNDTQVPVSDTCGDEDQDEDEMLRRAIELSLRNDDAEVCEPRPDCKIENYQYSPLPLTETTIRLLCIPPADHISDPLVCQMHQVRLNDKPKYAALSYTWGAPVFDHHVICDGRRLAITAHLDVALRRFRRTGWWMLWVDAVCIDQTNIPERNYQVSIVKHIYSRALRTFVYLGEPCLFDGKALKLMMSLAQLVQLLEKFSLIELQNMKLLGVATSRAHDAVIRFMELKNAGFPGARTRTTDLFAAGLPHPQHPAWVAMQSLFSSPWFRRMWIIQEVVLSSDVVVMIGGYRFEWVLVTRTMHAYNEFGLNLIPVKELQNTTVTQNFMKSAESVLGLLQVKKNSQYRSLIQLLCSFRKCHSSDPRDKVYALVGLANDQGLHQMVPVDYAKSVEAVYIECAKFLVRNGNGMEMLIQAGILQGCNDTSVGLSLPSWVPDWSQEEFTPIDTWGELYRAAGETQPDMGFETHGIGLHVKGIRIDVIDALAPIMDVYKHGSSPEPRQLVAWEQEVRAVARQSRFFSEERLDDYAKALGLGLCHRGGDNDGYTTAADFDDFWKGKRSTNVNVNYFAGAVNTATHHRFCVTRQGYMGWAPSYSQPGDLIIVLYGGPTLFVVRETNGGYLLSGNSYLEGFMSGEALKLEDAEPEDFLLL